jgi:hypothetical protein
LEPVSDGALGERLNLLWTLPGPERYVSNNLMKVRGFGLSPESCEFLKLDCLHLVKNYHNFSQSRLAIFGQANELVVEELLFLFFCGRSHGGDLSSDELVLDDRFPVSARFPLRH